MRRSLLALAVLAAVLPASAADLVPTLVRDINPFRDDPRAIFQLTAVGGGIFFVGNDGRTGYELWRSDGTAAGTVRVADLHAGPDSSVIYAFTAVGSRLFFVDEDATGHELWSSDGTAAGTRRVADVRPCPGIGGLADMIGWNGRLFFAGDDGTSGCELWTSDGSTAGTHRVAAPGLVAAPSGLTDGRDRLFFVTGLYASELWTTDGTPAGTTRLAGGMSIDRDTMRSVGGTLFFLNEGRLGLELWTSDGSATGTNQVVTFNGFPERFVIAVGNRLVLVFFIEEDSERTEIWTSDGTRRGTELLGDAFPGTSGLPPRHLTAFGGRIFFTTRDATDVERLWTVDDSHASAQLLVTLPSGTHVTRTRDAGVLAFTTFDDVAHILWTSDGTPAGTVALGPVVVDPDEVDPLPTAAGGLVYFVGHQERRGYALWTSDGTVAGTREVAGISPRTADAFPSWLTPVGQTLYFGADDGTVGRELWRSDGTANGTVLVEDIAPGAGGSDPSALTDVDGRLFFFTQAASSASALLWTSDGTAAGTIPVADVPAVPELTHAVGDTLYFVTSPSGDPRATLWGSDGTGAGTRVVANLPLGAFAFGLSDLHGALLLSLGGAGLWRSDGTAAGTARILDRSTLALGRFGDAIYFTGFSPGLGWVLWRSDGTRAGTAELAFAWASRFTAVADTLFFMVPPVLGGTEVALWRTDGTAPGTIPLLAGLPPILKQIALDDALLFTVPGPIDQQRLTTEIWTSDGSAAGTRRLTTLAAPGTSFPPASDLAAIGRTAFFGFDDGVSGQELWMLRVGCGGDAGTCDDGDDCTADACREHVCVHDLVPGVDGVGCRLRGLLALPACVGKSVPRKLRLSATVARVETLVQRATVATRPGRMGRLLAKADGRLRLLRQRTERLARRGTIEAACRDGLARGIDERRVLVAGLRQPS